MEVPAKRKSTANSPVWHSPWYDNSKRIQRRTYTSCLLIYTGESCSGPYVRKELVSSESSQDTLASQLFDSSHGFWPIAMIDSQHGFQLRHLFSHLCFHWNWDDLSTTLCWKKDSTWRSHYLRWLGNCGLVMMNEGTEVKPGTDPAFVGTAANTVLGIFKKKNIKLQTQN